MAEEMLSSDDAAELKSIFMKIVDGVEKTGMPRSLIGSAMVGIGAGIVAAHSGNDSARVALQGALDACLADENPLQ